MNEMSNYSFSNVLSRYSSTELSARSVWPEFVKIFGRSLRLQETSKQMSVKQNGHLIRRLDISTVRRNRSNLILHLFEHLTF